jgi:hypothetical protein
MKELFLNNHPAVRRINASDFAGHTFAIVNIPEVLPFLVIPKTSIVTIRTKLKGSCKASGGLRDYFYEKPVTPEGYVPFGGEISDDTRQSYTWGFIPAELRKELDDVYFTGHYGNAKNWYGDCYTWHNSCDKERWCFSEINYNMLPKFFPKTEKTVPYHIFNVSPENCVKIYDALVKSEEKNGDHPDKRAVDPDVILGFKIHDDDCMIRHGYGYVLSDGLWAMDSSLVNIVTLD